jgi:NitT/TauT family transport system substrate-binding protein
MNFHRNRRWLPVVAIAAILTLVVSACSSGGGSSSSGSSGSGKLTKATLRLDWSWFPYHEGFLLAQERGYYKQAGIDLTIEQGQGSGTTVTLVGQGKDTFGFADTGTAALQISKGVPVQVVLVVKRQAGYGAVCQKQFNVTTPAQLEGHSVIMVPQESTAQIWPAFVKANNLDLSKIKVLNADFSNKVSLYAADKSDCMAGYWAEDALQAKIANPDQGPVIKWSDFGVNLFGHGIEVNTSTLKKDPNLVKNFVAATIKGYQAMCADIPAAIQDFDNNASLKLQPADKTFAEQNLPLECQLMQPAPGDPGKTLGSTTDAEWKSMLDLLNQYGGLTPELAPDKYYTNTYLPASDQ